MTNKEKNIIISILFGIVLIFAFQLGYRTYPKWNTPIVDCDTIWGVDTIMIRDTFPYYVERLDTIIFRDTIRITDTIKVLKDYTAIHYYQTEWNDTNLFVSNNIAISENKILDQVFNYKIKWEPVVNVNYSYTKYLYLSGTINTIPKYSSVGLFYASQKGLIGLGYSPFSGSVSLTGGFKIAKIK